MVNGHKHKTQLKNSKLFGLCLQNMYLLHESGSGNVLKAFSGTDFSPFVFSGILVGNPYKYDGSLITCASVYMIYVFGTCCFCCHCKNSHDKSVAYL